MSNLNELCFVAVQVVLLLLKRMVIAERKEDGQLRRYGLGAKLHRDCLRNYRQTYSLDT